MKKLLLLLFLTVPLAAQIVSHSLDLTTGALKIPGNDTLPGSCVGTDLFLDTNETSGARLFACESNLYVLQGSGGSATSIHYKDWSFMRRDGVAGVNSKISGLGDAQNLGPTGTWIRAMPSLDGTSSEWMNLEWYIPADWTGTLDFYWGWGYTVSATAGDKVRFLFDFGCIGPADAIDSTPPSIINKDVTKTIVNIGFRDLNVESHLAVDISASCNPEELMILRFGRDPAHADDNRTDDATFTNLQMRFETTP